VPKDFFPVSLCKPHLLFIAPKSCSLSQDPIFGSLACSTSCLGADKGRNGGCGLKPMAVMPRASCQPSPWTPRILAGLHGRRIRDKGNVLVRQCWERHPPSCAKYSFSMILARPKSAILQQSVSETRMLAALKSRWMEFIRSMYAIPSAT